VDGSDYINASYIDVSHDLYTYIANMQCYHSSTPIDNEVKWVLKKRVLHFFKSYDIPTSLSYHISLALTHAVILQCLSCRATTYSKAAYSAIISHSVPLS